MTKVLASENRSQYLDYLEQYQSGIDKGLTKAGIPRSDLWKYSEYGASVKSSILRA